MLFYLEEKFSKRATCSNWQSTFSWQTNPRRLRDREEEEGLDS